MKDEESGREKNCFVPDLFAPDDQSSLCSMIEWWNSLQDWLRRMNKNGRRMIGHCESDQDNLG
jgi:hypothetical protein